MIMSGSAAKNNPEHNSGSAAKDMFFPPPKETNSGSAAENIRIQPI